MRADLDDLHGRHVELKRKFRTLYLAYRQLRYGGGVTPLVPVLSHSPPCCCLTPCYPVPLASHAPVPLMPHRYLIEDKWPPNGIPPPPQVPTEDEVLGSAFEDISRYRGGWGQRKVEVIRRGGPAAHPMRAPLPIFRSAPEAHPACTLTTPSCPLQE